MRHNSLWAAAALIMVSGAAHAQSHGAGNSLVFVEDFESYTPGLFPCEGAACIGPGAWTLWWYNYGPGPRPAEIVEGQAFSGQKSVRVSPRSDILRSGHLAQGTWLVRAQTFVPADATAPEDNGYFILLNECNLSPPIIFSVLVLFEGPSGLVKLIGGAGDAPLKRGEWAPIELEIDLAVNLMTVRYDGQVVAESVPYAGSGEVALQCVAIYSDGIEGMLFDDVSVQPVGTPNLCYANCDGSTLAPALNVADFSCFLQRFARGNIYANCDGSTDAPILNVADFTCFLTHFAAGCP